MVITADEIAPDPARAAAAAREIAGTAPDGYWLHLDLDILGPDLDLDGGCVAMVCDIVLDGLAHLGEHRAASHRSSRQASPARMVSPNRARRCV